MELIRLARPIPGALPSKVGGLAVLKWLEDRPIAKAAWTLDPPGDPQEIKGGRAKCGA
jgi:hypothetical protein